MKFLAALCLSILADVSCQSPASESPDWNGAAVVPAKMVSSDSTTLGGTWFLQPVLASDIAAGKTPSLVFDLTKSRFAGNTGCNVMNGTFWFSGKDSSLSFSDKINTTKMSCTGYNEPAFIKSLHNAGRYRLNNGTLTLLSDDNAELSRWMRKPGSLPKALKA